MCFVWSSFRLHTRTVGADALYWGPGGLAAATFCRASQAVASRSGARKQHKNTLKHFPGILRV